jgi:hypothetical protein
MPATTTCPDCHRDLRVPDNLLGTLVRCPHCQSEFTAGAATPMPGPQPAPVESDPFADTLAKPEPPPSDAFRAADTESPADAPVYGPIPLPPRPDLDADDEDDDDLDERYQESRLRRIEQESYENAKRRVLPPAICLMVTGGICLVIDAFRIIMLVIQVAAGAFAAPPPGAAPFGGMEFAIGVAVGSIGMSILWGSLVLYAGIKLKQLKSYGMVMAGCIIAMLPCFDACCLLGLPFGIWALVLIHDDQIRRHFA